jgi:hypothetical protein
MVLVGGRNPFKEARLDELPDGAPNTPVRRLSHDIRTALSLPDLAALMRSNRHKQAQNVWRDKHEAGVLMRAAALVYFKAEANGGEAPLRGRSRSQLSPALPLPLLPILPCISPAGVGDLSLQTARLRSELQELLSLCAEAAHLPQVLRLVEGDRARELLASCAKMGCTLPRALLTALLRELLRDSGAFRFAADVLPHAPPPIVPSPNPPAHQPCVLAWCAGKKLPGGDVARMSELVWALAQLRAGFTSGGGRQRPSSRVLGSSQQQQQQQASTSSASAEADAGMEVHRSPGPGAASGAAGGSGLSSLWRELQRCMVLALQQRRRNEELLQGCSALQAASQTAWAFAVAGCRDPLLFRLVEELAAEAAASPASLANDPRAVANLAYAFAKADRLIGGTLLPLLCRAFAQSLRGRVGGPEEAGFLGEAGPSTSGSGSGGSVDSRPGPAHIAKIAWATAVLRYKDTDLLYGLSAALTSTRYRLGLALCSALEWGDPAGSTQPRLCSNPSSTRLLSTQVHRR